MDAALAVQLLGSPAAGNDSPVYAWNSSSDSFISETDVATFTDGGHLIAYIWSDGSSTKLYARRSDAQGQATTDPFLVHDFGSMTVVSGNITVRVATFANGEYAILWRDSESLSGQRYYSSNDAAGTPFLVTPTQTIGVFGFDVAAKSNGHLYVIWANGRRLPVLGVELDTQGNQVQPPKSLVFPTLSDMLEEVVAESDGGDGVILSWRVAQSNPTGIGHRYLAFSSQLDPISDLQTIDSPTAGMGPEILRLSPGRNVWAEQIFDAGTTRLQVQLRDDQGNIITPVIDASLNSSTLIPPQLTLWPGRGFLLTYLEADDSGYHLYVRAFNHDGAPLSAPLLVMDSLDLPTNQFQTMALTSERFGVTWVESSNPLAQVMKERTWQLSTLALSLQIDAPAGTIHPSTHEILVTNLPATIGLANGIQEGPNQWRLTLDQAAQMQLLTHGPWPVVRMTLNVVDKATGDTVVSHDVTLGTETDDQFFLPEGVSGQVEGLLGYDQLVLSGVSSEYIVQPVDTNRFHLTSTTQTTDLYLSAVDALMFFDGTFAVEDLVETPAPPTLPEPPTDPYPADPTDAPTPSEETPSAEEPPSTTDDDQDPEITDETDEESDPDDTDLLGLYVFNGNLVADNLAWDVSGDVSDSFSDPSLDMIDSPESIWQDLDWLQSSDSASDMAPMMASQDLELLNDIPSSPPDETPADTIEPPHESVEELTTEEGDQGEASQELSSDDGLLEAPLETLELSEAEVALNANNSHDAAARELERGATRQAFATTAAVSQQAPQDVSPWTMTRPVGLLPSTLFETARLAARTRLDDRSPPERRAALQDDSVRFHSPELNVTTRFASQELFTEMDTIDREVAQDVQHRQLMVGTAVVVATGFSVAQIAWLLRGSLIITQTLSSLPIWVGFDPLPVLNSVPSPGFGNLPVGSDESLLDLVRR